MQRIWQIESGLSNRTGPGILWMCPVKVFYVVFIRWRWNMGFKAQSTSAQTSHSTRSCTLWSPWAGHAEYGVQGRVQTGSSNIHLKEGSKRKDISPFMTWNIWQVSRNFPSFVLKEHVYGIRRAKPRLLSGYLDPFPLVRCFQAAAPHLSLFCHTEGSRGSL